MAYQEANKVIKAGDIVFIRIANFLYRRVAEVTKSWTSHVGIIHSKKGDDWIVAESAVPVSKYCSLKEFISRSENNAFAITRVQEKFSKSELDKIRSECSKRIGSYYHLGFKFDSKLQFCSKFVYEVYKSALGVEIGKFETFRDLLNNNPKTPLWFWRMWYLGQIPWDRATITPASQYESKKTKIIYSNNV